MEHTLIVFPNITAMMCGVTMVRKFRDRVELQYSDGTVESAPRNHPAMADIDWDSPFSIVGSTQEAARS